MKRYIYITLLVFATLFCQAFGAQNGWPTFYDTICAKPGDTVHMSQYESQILELLQSREESLWSECCDKVTITLGDISGSVIENNTPRPFKGLPDEKINTEKTIQVDVKYTRELVCSKIPSEKKSNMPPASLAMWHLFGKLLSETDTKRVETISDVATVTTLHQATFFYRFGLAFPEDPLSQIIQEREMCLDNPSAVGKLHLEERYYPYTVNWEDPTGVGIEEAYRKVLIPYPNERYLFPIICTATACKGETRSDTVFIGKPTPTPEVDDLGCIAANDTSFEVNVNNPNSQLSYHWTLEDFGNGTIVDTQQGASVTMRIPQKEAVKLKLVSTGGCKASDAVTQILHRSVVAGNIQLQGDTNCVFIGDTLRFVLQNAPQDSLVWKSETGVDTLLGNAEFICNTTGWNTNSFKVSVSNKNCPESVDSNTFNIRKDLEVSIEPYESCIRTDTANVFKISGNGINPEVHWYGNGIDIDSTTYSAKDSILLRLTNPGDPNLYVAVTAKECDRETPGDTVYLHPRPKKPQLDTLWNALTTCIPLGIDTSIELRVQPQEGVKFKWSIPDIITNPDSNSILARVNYDLSDRDTSILVSVYAYTDGCLDNSDALQDTLYATGAGLGEEWYLLQTDFLINGFLLGYMVGFSNDGTLLEGGWEDPLGGMYAFNWYSEDVYVDFPSNYVYYAYTDVNPPFPFDIFCKLTSIERQCYSVYSIEVVDMMEQQDVLFAAKKGGEETGKGRETESLQSQAPFEQEYTPCPGIVLKPNPVRSGVQVKVEGICETESFTVECYSSQGRLMFRTTAKGDTFTLPTDNYAAGVYIVKIQLNGTAAPIVKKLIIL